MVAAGIFVGPLEITLSQSNPEASRLPEAILAFAGTAIWGLLVLIALIVFRDPLAQFLSSIGRRVTKLSLAGIELELAESPRAELNADARSFGFMDPQDLANDSTSQTLLFALTGPVVPDGYAIIDLGIGQSWLLSRLFIFAMMLQQVRGVRCFVFVDTNGGRTPNQYVGTASTEEIRWALAARHTWLEQVLSKAYKDNLWRNRMPPVGAERRLDVYFAADVVQEYVKLLKKDRNWQKQPEKLNDPAAAEPTYPQLQPQLTNAPWVKVHDKMEYGFWLDRERLRQELKGVIHSEELPLKLPAQDKINEIVNSTAPFVAVVRDSGQFDSLLERAKVLEDMRKQTAQESSK